MNIQSESIGEIAKALYKVQSELEGAKKDSTNPFYKSKYADLESVWTAIREQLAKNELAVTQLTMPSANKDEIVIVTQLMHAPSGEWLRGYLPMPMPQEKVKPPEDFNGTAEWADFFKCTAQGAGIAITYGRRYGLSAIIGVIQEDTDAEPKNRYNDKNKKPPAKTAPPKTEKPPITKKDLTPELYAKLIGEAESKDNLQAVNIHFVEIKENYNISESQKLELAVEFDKNKKRVLEQK